jgi:hypothetical protein
MLEINRRRDVCDRGVESAVEDEIDVQAACLLARSVACCLQTGGKSGTDRLVTQYETWGRTNQGDCERRRGGEVEGEENVDDGGRSETRR